MPPSSYTHTSLRRPAGLAIFASVIYCCGWLLQLWQIDPYQSEEGHNVFDLFLTRRQTFFFIASPLHRESLLNTSQRNGYLRLHIIAQEFPICLSEPMQTVDLMITSTRRPACILKRDQKAGKKHKVGCWRYFLCAVWRSWKRRSVITPLWGMFPMISSSMNLIWER